MQHDLYFFICKTEGFINFKVYSITNTEFDETFGFTDEEVKIMPVSYTHLTLEVKGNMEGGIGIKGLLTLYSVFDLAGYYADLGLGVEAEFAYHDLENGSLACEEMCIRDRYH